MPPSSAASTLRAPISIAGWRRRSAATTSRSARSRRRARPSTWRSSPRSFRHSLVKAKALADRLYSQLKGGADFGALAKKYSQDPGSKAQGGQLTITKGQTVPEFDKTAFELKTNELSKPVHTQYGYHIIQALKPTTPRKVTAFAQVKEAIRQQLLQQKKSTSLQTWLDGVKKEYAS